MNESSDTNLLYSDRDISVFLSSSEFPEEESVLDSEVESSSLEESSEETSETNSEESRTTEQSSEVVVENETLIHIDKSLNSFLGLFVIVLVLVGCGLILKFIWGLLNK